MKELNVEEVEDVSGGATPYSVGYAVGSFLGGVANAIAGGATSYTSDLGAGAWG